MRPERTHETIRTTPTSSGQSRRSAAGPGGADVSSKCLPIPLNVMQAKNATANTASGVYRLSSRQATVGRYSKPAPSSACGKLNGDAASPMEGETWGEARGLPSKLHRAFPKIYLSRIGVFHASQVFPVIPIITRLSTGFRFGFAIDQKILRARAPDPCRNLPRCLPP